MTLSCCLSRGFGGRDCRVLCVIYAEFKELCIDIGFIWLVLTTSTGCREVVGPAWGW